MTASTFRLDRQMNDLRFRIGTLTAREWITPTYVRVRLEGDDFAGFDSPGADDHMRLFFPDRDPSALSVEELRAAPSREYTPLTWSDTHLDVEFAVHGDAGVAAPWAATAPIGAKIGVGGPRGSMVIDGRPDGWFLAGDETAVPAIRRFAALMPSDATGQIVVEVTDAAHELAIDAPAGVAVTQLHRGSELSGAALAAALATLTAEDRPTGSVFGFVAAEQSIVKPGRALLIDRWGLSSDQIVVKGYWKRGEAEYHAPH